MNESIKVAYSEVYEILRQMDKIQVMKVPIEILEKIKQNRDQNYISKIDKNDIFNKNNISKLTLHMLAYLNLNYWVDKNKKLELTRLYYTNEEKLKNEKFATNNIFNNKKNVTEVEKKHKNISIVVYKESIFSKIRKFFKSIFKI